MKEVKLAWTSLLSSRNLSKSGTVALSGESTNGNDDGCTAVKDNSRATWYDAPIPVIIHERKFSDREMDSSDVRVARETTGMLKSSLKDEKSSKESDRRVGKDSKVETVASLRRTFLDDFRKANSVNDYKIIFEDKRRTLENSSTPSKPRPRGESRLSVGNEEVLYQNNVEAALNSLSKICSDDLDVSGDSPERTSADLKDTLAREDFRYSDDDSNGSVGFERGRRRRKSSSASRRHSSSVELTAKTTIKTNDDGMPMISFSFLRNEENGKAFARDISLNDDEEVVMSLEVSEQPVADGLYDFPKSAACKRLVKSDVEDNVANETRKSCGHLEKSEKKFKVDAAGGRNPADAGNRLYDLPKKRTRRVPAEYSTIVGKEAANDEGVSKRFSKSASSIDIENEEDKYELYDLPIDPRDSSTLGPSSNGTSNNHDGAKTLAGSENRCKRTSRSLRSGRSVGRMESLEIESPKDVKAYYSDPECQDSSGQIDELDNDDGRKNRKRNRRLGKAWGKMRSWLREERSRLGEVVTRHARMQAVGVTRAGNTENAASLGSRSGSYDLIEARARELGDVVDEPGLSSVSEEGNVSDSERPEWSSSELHPGERGGIATRVNDNDGEGHDGSEDPKGTNRVAANSSDDSPDGELASGKSEKTLGTNCPNRGMRMKVTPVSLSVDKLCSDEMNDDGTNGVVARRDSEQTITRDHVGKGGLIKRRMLGSIRGLMASTHLLQQHESEEGGPGGFEEVRRYVKQGGDFCKELAAILHERAELEASYSKGLSKLSGKLTKACAKDQGGNTSGGVTEAWRSIGEEMEAAAEAHRAWGAALSEQLAKPLRVGVAEAQGRSRKVIESSVDKASKSLQEWRGIAAKSKKQSFSCARDNERLQDLARIQSISQSQQNNNKTSSHQMTEKEVNKLETRRRKAEDSSRRADTEFYTISVRAERARLEYESTVRKGAKQMELLEEERLSALKDLANVYLAHLQALAPRLQQSADRLSSPVRSCNVSQDVDILKNIIRRLDSNDGSNVDQLLPDFYAEHVTLAMNRERRKQSLVRVLHLIRQDLERERRGREGLETLHRAFIQSPAFAADESTQNVTEKLHHMRSMLTFLEAARYKVGGTLAEIEGGKRGKHPLAEHILVSRDKQGLQQSVLKVPSWAKNESFEFPEVQDDLEIHLTKDHDSERRDWVDRTAGDGNSENPPDEEDFSDFDEFSSQSEDNNNQEVEINDIADKADIIEQCRAIYQYSANLNDELSLTPGDLITIHEKQADGWWIGECAGRTGIFPATYVQLIH